MNYIVSGTTALRYLIPLMRYAKSVGKNSHKVFLQRSGKYNCPLTVPRNNAEIHLLASRYGFDIYHIDEIKNHPGITFMVEADGLESLNHTHVKVSMTYMTDFKHLYNRYVKDCDYVIFPSEIFASHYNCVGDKNLYLGSTKYDYDFQNENRLSEITTDDPEKVLIVYPRYRDLGKINIEEIVKTVRGLGFNPIIKYRMKEPVKSSYGCETICDEYWYPHVTLDLINQAKFVVNTGSTTLKESILFKKPLLSLNIKPEVHLTFLAGYNFEEVLSGKDINQKNMEASIERLLSKDGSYEFDKCIKEKLFEPGKTSQKILDFFNVDC